MTDKSQSPAAPAAARSVPKRKPARQLLKECLLVAGALVLMVVMVLWLSSLLAGVVVRFIPTSVDRAVGEAVWDELAPDKSRCENPELVRYVEQVAQPLINSLDDDRWTFTFAVVDEESANAMALPGGYIVVHSGLLELIGAGDELAAVLAHEIQHAVQRHGMVAVLRSAGGVTILGMAIGTSEASALFDYALELGNLSYGRSEESEADAAGRALLKRAGISPGALATFFGRIEEKYGEDIEELQFLSSHPATRERIEAAKRDAEGFVATRELPPPPEVIRCR